MNYNLSHFFYVDHDGNMWELMYVITYGDGEPEHIDGRIIGHITPDNVFGFYEKPHDWSEEVDNDLPPEILEKAMEHFHGPLIG